MKQSNGKTVSSFVRSTDSPSHLGSSAAQHMRDCVIVKPDIKQMTCFKPSTSIGVGMNSVPGGAFPLPSALSNLLSRLPPPDCFHVREGGKEGGGREGVWEGGGREGGGFYS